MEYTVFSQRQAVAVYASRISQLFCRVTAEDVLFYKPIDTEQVERCLTGEGKQAVVAVDRETEALLGFASGCVSEDEKTGYISFVAVCPEYRRRGVGTALLRELETCLTAGRLLEKIDIVFHNPTHLAWWIPGGDGADHPCTPGVAFGSAGYYFFQNHGYRLFAIQNSYYLKLDGYKEPEDLAEKRVKLAEKGIAVTTYNEASHHGLAELFVNIHNPGWAKTVLAHGERPVIVAVDNRLNGLVVGYTGPLSIDPSGRGNFCGIGTHTQYRGQGIGKVVFCEMCRRHSEAGAKFMSLYTGEDNPARNIYEAAGFRIVRSWANLRKPVGGKK